MSEQENIKELIRGLSKDIKIIENALSNIQEKLNSFIDVSEGLELPFAEEKQVQSSNLSPGSGDDWLTAITGTADVSASPIDKSSTDLSAELSSNALNNIEETPIESVNKPVSVENLFVTNEVSENNPFSVPASEKKEASSNVEMTENKFDLSSDDLESLFGIKK